MSRFFATAPRGIEEVLADELRQLDVPDVAVDRGGVAFGGSLEHAYRACLWSRTAARVLMPLTQFEARDAKALYAGVHAIPWAEHLGPERTLAVDVAGRNAPVGPPHFVAMKTKDALVDRVREAEGSRPSVDTSNPDVRIHVHLRGARVSIALDLAGQGLHHRGIGRQGSKAPLKENLAAAVLHLAGWPAKAPSTPLVDPFCGSATLLVEAAWMALDIAPGLERGALGAEGWRGHDAKLWRRLLDEAHQRRRRGLSSDTAKALRLAGSDGSPGSLHAARDNLRRAGVDHLVRLEARDLRDVEPPWDAPGLLVTNPPYGARLGSVAELMPLYELLGDVLKRRFPGWTGWVLCGEPSLAKRIGLRPASRTVLFNGPIECRLVEIPIADKPVDGDGPGWRKPSPEAEAFGRKLLKNRKQLGRWAKRQKLDCFRLYDTDMRQFNLAVDWYGDAVRVEEYEPPPKVNADDAARRLREALQVIPETLGVDPAHVVLRVRGRMKDGEQQGRRDDRRHERAVQEGPFKFLVNLEDYLDTGLFLDDRRLRRRIAQSATDKDFLNLFAYTCTASVAAALGGGLDDLESGARSTTSVDLSKTYLAWGRRNFQLNGLDDGHASHRFIRADAMEWLTRLSRRRYDLIFVAPPTWSRSKVMRDDFDIQRDHVKLLRHCHGLLAPGGEVLFTTNLRTFELAHRALERGYGTIEDITESITPKDFSRRPRLKAWSLRAR